MNGGAGAGVTRVAVGRPVLTLVLFNTLFLIQDMSEIFFA